MPPAPNLETYQQAANSIYDPQQTAEAASLGTKLQTTINTLEGGKALIQQDYQTAIDNLATSVLKQTGKINQLYTQRLGGNFSGLQGNDLGMLFSSANKQQAGIETTRANKLAAISTEETNAKLTEQTDLGNLGSKYNSLRNQYANTNYGAAVKQYQTDQYHQEQLALSQERLNISASRANKAAKAPKATATDVVNYWMGANMPTGNYNPNGTNYHRWQAAEQDLMANGLNPQDASTQALLKKVFGGPGA